MMVLGAGMSSPGYGRLRMMGVQKFAMGRRYWLAGVACDNDLVVEQFLCKICRSECWEWWATAVQQRSLKIETGAMVSGVITENQENWLGTDETAPMVGGQFWTVLGCLLEAFQTAGDGFLAYGWAYFLQSGAE